MNASQRRLLVAACVLGAVLLHLWNGTWHFAQADRRGAAIDLVWLSYNGLELEGLAIPVCLLVAAAFVRLGGRPAPTAR